MSEPAVLPKSASAYEKGRAVLPAGVALVSFASLLLELALTRLFSVVLFYHFAFLAISIALLGLGAGGVFAHLRRQWLARWELRRLGGVLCAVNALAVLAALEVVLHVPVLLNLEWANFGRLTVIYLAAGVPFFFTGLLFSLVFARENRRVTQLYGADLAGGAAACLSVVPLLDRVGGPNAVVCAALAMAVAAGLWAGRSRLRTAAAVLAVLIAGLLAANHSGRLIDIVYAKGMRRDRPWMLFARWNAISRVEVDQQGEFKTIVIDADAATAIMNVDPEHWGEAAAPRGGAHTMDGGRPGYNWKEDLMSQAPAIANVLRPKGDYAIIGPGGGVDVLRAVANGSPNVTGIEINPIIATTIMRGRYADYSYHLYELPQVHMHVSDGRSWIRNSRQKYDVIQMTLVDTWASTAAGAFALSENNLYTVEAFREYFDHLKPDGFIAITRWEFKRPREALRVASQAIEALHRIEGYQSHTRNFMVVGDGPLDEDGRPVTVLAKKSPFTAEEEAAVRAHMEDNPNLVPLYLASQQETAPDSQARWNEPGAHSFRALIQSDDPSSFADGYPYNIAPVTDNKPFFFFTFKTGDVLRRVLSGSGRGMDWKNNLGVVVLGMLLVISVAAVLVFLVVPLLAHGEGHGQHVVPLLYFVAIGLGYILVEIALIQRFVLFLGHPTYALTVVVFLMLLASGAGSVLSRRWLARTAAVRWVLAGIVAGVAAYIVVLPRLLGGLVGMAFPLKLVVSGVLLAPLGWLMGMPFPTGLRELAAGAEAAQDVPAPATSASPIEWAWAMNAASSVLGSAVAMVVAMHFGLNVALGCAAGAYLGAMGVSLGWRG